MALLQTRIRKLEMRLADHSRLIIHSQGWFDYWHERLERVIAGEDVKEQLPLAFIDALLSETRETARR